MLVVATAGLNLRSLAEAQPGIGRVLRDMETTAGGRR
jgi:hypothetical protein